MTKIPLRNRFAVLLTVFLLGSHYGNLALWIGEDPEPARVFCCRVATLPVADQILLGQGIRLDSEEALAKVLENYL